MCALLQVASVIPSSRTVPVKTSPVGVSVRSTSVVKAVTSAPAASSTSHAVTVSDVAVAMARPVFFLLGS